MSPMLPRNLMMLRITRIATTVVFAVLAATLFSPDLQAAEEELGCTPRTAVERCGDALIVGDPDFPCIVRDGQAFCPVIPMFRNAVIIAL